MLSAQGVASALAWFPIRHYGDYEKDYYPAIRDELEEVFGQTVFEQLPVVSGTTLNIDLHVGDPAGHGIGIEVKLPFNNADVQRAQGQMDQYQRRYGSNLVVLIIPEFIRGEVLHGFVATLQRMKIATVVR